MLTQFNWAVEDDGILLGLTGTTKRMFRPDVSATIRADQWVEMCPTALGALTRLEIAVLDGEEGIRLLPDNASYQISHAFAGYLAYQDLACKLLIGDFARLFCATTSRDYFARLFRATISHSACFFDS